MVWTKKANLLKFQPSNWNELSKMFLSKMYCSDFDYTPRFNKLDQYSQRRKPLVTRKPDNFPVKWVLRNTRNTKRKNNYSYNELHPVQITFPFSWVHYEITDWSQNITLTQNTILLFIWNNASTNKYFSTNSVTFSGKGIHDVGYLTLSSNSKWTFKLNV